MTPMFGEGSPIGETNTDKRPLKSFRMTGPKLIKVFAPVSGILDTNLAVVTCRHNVRTVICPGGTSDWPIMRRCRGTEVAMLKKLE